MSNYLKTAIGILNRFTNDQITNFIHQVHTKGKPQSLDELLSYIVDSPTLVKTRNLDDANIDQIQSIAEMVTNAYRKTLPLSIIIITEEKDILLENIRRFHSYDDYISEKSIKLLTQDQVFAATRSLGIHQSWLDNIFHFSGGNPANLNMLWNVLQKNQQNSDPRTIWDLDEPFSSGATAKYSSQNAFENFSDIIINLIIEQSGYTFPETHQHHKLRLKDCLYLAAAMGDTFIPQAIAESALPENRQFTEQEAEEFEDLWFDFLETENSNGLSIAQPVEIDDKPAILKGNTKQVYIYKFTDPHFKASAKQRCHPATRQQDLYRDFQKLNNWIEARFQDIWLQVLPNLIAINEAIWHPNADTFANILRHHKEAENLEIRIQKERESVQQGKPPENLFYLLEWYADTQYKLGHYPTALAAQQEAYAFINSGAIKLKDLRLAIFLNQLGLYNYYTGNYSTAEPLYRRALKIDETQLGATHPYVATSLNNLALLLESQGNYSAAEPLYRRALAIAEKSLGKDHPNTVIFRENYEDLLSKINNPNP